MANPPLWIFTEFALTLVNVRPLLLVPPPRLISNPFRLAVPSPVMVTVLPKRIRFIDKSTGLVIVAVYVDKSLPLTRNIVPV